LLITQRERRFANVHVPRLARLSFFSAAVPLPASPRLWFDEVVESKARERRK
jgi:hypothetical protein